jgi:putative Ca2+/H+ antiporter (TMEM165/GDT1 family)
MTLAAWPSDWGLADEQAEAAEAVAGCTSLGQAGVVGRMVVMEALALTFVAEWGDRTQLATITLSTANHPLGVIVGATLGHAICAAIAVMAGNFVGGSPVGTVADGPRRWPVYSVWLGGYLAV